MNILIYAENGVGLGHIVRTINIARCLRDTKKELNVLFITPSKFKDIFKLNNFDVLTIPRPSSEENISFIRRFLFILHNFRPDIFLVDGHFPEFIFRLRLLDDVKKILILRKVTNSKIFVLNKGGYCNFFDLVLFPHSREEFLHYGLKNAFISSLDNKKFLFTGPILPTSFNFDKLRHLKKKYGLNADKFNILFTNGGGGANKENTSINDFSELVKNTIKKFNGKTNINFIVVEGPYFEFVNSFDPYSVIKTGYEPFLFELLFLVDLVVSPAGYNICNEIKLIGVPSILVPIKRHNESQHERANFFKKEGVCEVLNNFDVEGLYRLIVSFQKKKEVRKTPPPLDEVKLSRLRDVFLDNWGAFFMDRVKIMVNSHCNNKCSFCSKLNKKGVLLRKELIRLLLTFSKIREEVIFTGGEPTLRGNLDVIIGYAKRLSYKTIAVESNGRSFSDLVYCKELIAAGANKFIINLFGKGAGEHDDVTGVDGSFDQVVSGIKNLRDLNQEVVVTQRYSL